MEIIRTAVIMLATHPVTVHFFARAPCPAPTFILTMVVMAAPKELGRLKHTDVMLLAIP